ncbi:MAG: sensor domain-containing diguanylate cyclase [Polyangiaceae bacterium]
MGGRPAEKKGAKSSVKKRRKASLRSPRKVTTAPTKAQMATNDPARRALLTLLELTQTLTDDHPLEESLRHVTEAALDLVPGDHASIRLLDGTHTELLSGARSGAGEALPPMTFRRGEGLIGWVVEHRHGIRVGQAGHDPRFKPAPTSDTKFPIQSIIAEPLWSAGNVIGAVSVSSPNVHAFTADHELLVRLLANCSAPPIERVRLRRLAMTDDLTLAYNQRYLAPRFYEEIERARRNRADMSVLMMDLDHFKRVNDEHGHAVGDSVLRFFADRVRSVVRKVDIFIRRGGEEFNLVMPGTSLEHARATAERIRRAQADAPFEIDDLKIKQTVSIGVATWNGEETPEELQRRADMAMYRAKENGRNCVEIARDEEVPSPLSLRPAVLDT